jgi:endonuclease III-like uncharacterized protein
MWVQSFNQKADLLIHTSLSNLIDLEGMGKETNKNHILYSYFFISIFDKTLFSNDNFSKLFLSHFRLSISPNGCKVSLDFK